MEQTHAFIKESLRITPPLPIAIPRVPINDVKIGDIVFDKDTSVR